MGYEVPDTTLLLVFADPSFQGLEVRCRLASVGQVTEAAKLAGVDPQNVTAEDAEVVERVVAGFAEALQSWNLTRRGKRVPATRKGIGTLDSIFQLQLINAWLAGSGKLISQRYAASGEVDESTLQVDALD